MARTLFNRYALLGSALLFLLSFAVYYNTLGNGFVSDDADLIITNPWIRDAANIGKFYSSHTMGYCETCPPISYRPSIFAYYILEYALFGLAPAGWHLVNILLHSINSVAVFALLSVLFRDAFKQNPESRPMLAFVAPFAGAAFFASHPVNNEPVAWISCVGELTFALLSLAAFLIHIRSMKRAAGGSRVKAFAYRIAPALLYFAALTFKETAVFLPLLVFIYDRLAYGGEKLLSRGVMARYLPYFIAASLYLLARFAALGNITPQDTFHEYLSVLQFLLNAFVLFVQYIGMLFMPVNGNPMQLFKPAYSLFEPKAVLSIVGLFVSATLLLAFRKKVHPLYYLAIAMMILPLLPVLISPAVSKAPLADRYLYFPSIGFSAIIALLVRQALGASWKTYAKGAVLSVAALTVAAYSFEAARKNLAWKSDVTLWSAASAASPGNYLALYRTGKALIKEGRPGEAVPRLEEAIRINSGRENPDLMILLLSRSMLAAEYNRKGMAAEAAGEYGEILKISPDDLIANYNLASFHKAKGDFDYAIELYLRASLFADSPLQLRDIYSSLGDCFAGKSQWKQALEYYEEALKHSGGDIRILAKAAAARNAANGF